MGLVVGATDRDYLRLELIPKCRPGVGYKDIRPIVMWLTDDCILFTDSLSAYGAAQIKHPDKIEFLGQVNHTNEEWVREVEIDGEKYLCSTQNIDGVWSHLQARFGKHKVKQADRYRYMKAFEVEW